MPDRGLKSTLLVLAAGVGIVLFAGCSLPSVTPVALTGVALDKPSAMLWSGETQQLTAVIEPADAANRNVTWTSGDPGIAAVTSSGLVTAVSAGAATITVTTADGGKTATCAVSVMSTQVVTSAADRLVATQNSDGGWEWQAPDTNPSTGVPSPYNTLGVTAQGMLDAYRVTGNAAYLAASVSTYQALLANSQSLTPAVHKIRGADITFLVGLSTATGNAVYATFARTRYQSALAEFGAGTASGLAAALRDGRLVQPPLISWDIDLLVRGVAALDSYFPGQGFAADARAMTEVIFNALYQAPALFDVANLAQNEYWLSITGAVDSFTLTGLHAAERDSLKATLLANQEPDGHFPEVGGGDLQTTAYAVMALVKAGEAAAAMKGVTYLSGTQAANGGWKETDVIEYTESDSEVLHAIYECMARF